ncbi:hypothetical protein NML43_16495 [Rhodopseudomonas palustris]|nr:MULTISPECIES: hypothetical protein [Rhodopseudomonas]MCP9628693.1 hypothetical protein [Rhodopseudomonas palustris]
MMNFDMLLIAAGALSTAVILFGVVIMSDHEAEHQHAKAAMPPRHRD